MATLNDTSIKCFTQPSLEGDMSMTLPVLGRMAG